MLNCLIRLLYKWLFDGVLLCQNAALGSVGYTCFCASFNNTNNLNKYRLDISVHITLNDKHKFI